MTIDGLCVRPEVSPLTPYLRSGTPDVSEAVGVTVDAYKALGFTPDIDTATRSLTAQFTALAALGYDGRLVVEPPSSVSFDNIVAAAEGKRPGIVEPMYRYPNLWTPGSEENSYTHKELDAAPTEAAARLAIFNADKTSGVDPLLHFPDMPYDDIHRGKASKTQLEALVSVEEQFVSKHPNALLKALGHRAAVMLVLMDRIRGVDRVDPSSTDFVLNNGWLRVPELGRRTVGGDSVVGSVFSNGTQLRLVRSGGYASSQFGVGLSAGLNELNPQTS